MPFMKLSDAKERTKVRLDRGFTCGPLRTVTLRAGVDGELWFPCRAGRHYIDGQIGENDELIGMYLENN